MREPKNSCPDINSTQKELERGIKELQGVECEGLDQESIELAMRFMGDAIDKMEAVRKINEELREYANYWRQEHDNLLRDIGGLERLVESLKEERDYLLVTVDRLEAEVEEFRIQQVIGA